MAYLAALHHWALFRIVARASWLRDKLTIGIASRNRTSTGGQMEYNCSPTVGMERWQGRSRTQHSHWPQLNEGSRNRYIAPESLRPPQYVFQHHVFQQGSGHRKARISNADTRGCTQTTQMVSDCGSASCRSNASPTVCQPHRTICVLCVHLLTSALNPSLCRGVTGLAMRAEAISDRQSQHHRSRRVGPAVTTE
jgi:hypothetical protein